MIHIDRLTKRFGSRVVLRELCLQVPAGEHVAIRGPSGSGKTTLLRLIAGLEAPDEGRILLGGELASDPEWQRPPDRRELGFVFQRAALWPHITVAQNIRFGIMGLSPNMTRVRLDRLLAELDIASLRNCHPHRLSGGEARRVALARSLAPQPRRLLLDEPLTHLDDRLRDQVLTVVLEQVRQTQATLVVVTHDAHEAEQLATQQWLLRDGALVDAAEACP
ncbi:MAG: ABC transporter [Deltaproteobacteria bacterium]|nr:MAG: ABC transporter [Deltaproteobacteria bacterium]